MWVTLIVCASIVAVVGINVCGDRYSEYKMKKMQEDSKTAKLALTYQMLSARPELSLDEIKKYIESTETVTKQIENNND